MMTFRSDMERKNNGGLLYGQLYQTDELKYNEGEIMDSAKKSVEKVLEIAKKHGYACVVGFRQEGKASEFYPNTEEIRDMWGGCTGVQKDVDNLMYDCLQPVWDHYKY